MDSLLYVIHQFWYLIVTTKIAYRPIFQEGKHTHFIPLLIYILLLGSSQSKGPQNLSTSGDDGMRPSMDYLIKGVTYADSASHVAGTVSTCGDGIQLKEEDAGREKCINEKMTCNLKSVNVKLHSG
jgi:hypothetical protein